MPDTALDPTVVDDAEPEMEPWLAELAKKYDVTLAPFATTPFGATIWACMADCACLFLIDDTSFLDRFSLVTPGDGSCVDREECNCHALPPHNPAAKDLDHSACTHG